MESLRLKLLAARIEMLWWLIRRERHTGKRLLESGFSHSSRKLLSLNQRFSKHCTQAMKAQKEYESAFKIMANVEKLRSKNHRIGRNVYIYKQDSEVHLLNKYNINEEALPKILTRAKVNCKQFTIF